MCFLKQHLFFFAGKSHLFWRLYSKLLYWTCQMLTIYMHCVGDIVLLYKVYPCTTQVVGICNLCLDQYLQYTGCMHPTAKSHWFSRSIFTRKMGSSLLGKHEGAGQPPAAYATLVPHALSICKRIITVQLEKTPCIPIKMLCKKTMVRRMLYQIVSMWHIGPFWNPLAHRTCVLFQLWLKRYLTKS